VLIADTGKVYWSRLFGGKMDGWNAIRDLDEEVTWAERNAVVSKTDHFNLLESAKVCVCVSSKWLSP